MTAAVRERVWRDAYIVVAVTAFLIMVYDLTVVGGVFGDARSDWLPWHGPLYDPTQPLGPAYFNYSPAAALALWPLVQLPLLTFVVIWTAFGVAAYTWLLDPLPMVARLPAIGAGTLMALNGNIEWLLALVAVFGLRWPALWLVGLFTKVSPFLAFSWFVFRRDWRACAWTAAIAVVVVAVSAVLLPGAWQTWVGMVVKFSGQGELGGRATTIGITVPLPLRAVVAVAVTWWGARRDEPLVLPVALFLLQPDWQPWTFGYLAAVPRLRQGREESGTLGIGRGDVTATRGEPVLSTRSEGLARPESIG